MGSESGTGWFSAARQVYKLTITASKEGETDKTYMVELPMIQDVSNKSLAWETI